MSATKEPVVEEPVVEEPVVEEPVVEEPVVEEPVVEEPVVEEPVVEEPVVEEPVVEEPVVEEPVVEEPVVEEPVVEEPVKSEEPVAEETPAEEAPKKSEFREETAEAEMLAATREAAAEQTKHGQEHLRTVNRTLAGVGAVVAAALFFYGQPWDETVDPVRRAAGIGLPATVFVFAILGLLQRGHGGLVSYVIGKDKRISTSLTQVALWTVALAGAFLYFISLDLLSDQTAHGFGVTVGKAWSKLPEEYFILLGGPFAAAVIARMSIGTKVEQGRLQKVEANQTGLKDIVSNDDGRGSLVDAQFFVFNLVALVWFAAELIQTSTKIPSIPPLLVGLTGISALGYTAAKAAESNQPVISSITRRLGTALGGIRAGELVEVRGANFIPPGASTEEFLPQLVVRFGAVDVLPEIETDRQRRVISPTATSIVARVPETVQAGSVDISVVTAAGAESNPRAISIIPDKAVITGVEPTTPAAGEPLMLRGRGFRSPTAAPTAQPTVMFDDLPVEASSASDGLLEVVIPNELDEETVNIAVIVAGGTEPSDQIRLRLRRTS